MPDLGFAGRRDSSAWALRWDQLGTSEEPGQCSTEGPRGPGVGGHRAGRGEGQRGTLGLWPQLPSAWRCLCRPFPGPPGPWCPWRCPWQKGKGGAQERTPPRPGGTSCRPQAYGLVS